MSASVGSMRIVPELRAAHIERHLLGTPAELLYLDVNYDLAGTDLAPGIQRVTMTGALRRFLTTTATTLEVPEPLWMRFWPKHVLLAAGFRAAGVLRRRRHRVVTYAMENNDLATLVGGRRRVPGVVVRLVGLLVGAVARLTIDRIAFASDDARATYASLPFTAAIEQSSTLELPRPDDAPVDPTPLTCVFVGAMEQRKGVQELMDAWPAVERTVPGATIVLIGPGPLEPLAAEWAASSPSTRRVTGRLPHAAAAAVVRSSAVLVAPSVADGRWREQIGLPIKEALAAGLTIVTTDQTGLAGWLRDHGHGVVPPTTPAFTRRLARAITSALRAPLDREQVRAALPERDGRLAADAWLHGQQARLVADVPTRPIGVVA
ncbi:glycosyltransferase [Curtobacterium sp. SORGH_AS_0776]|uniref:glycosyltransferase n=1 Tax=Curtobacterium sp. SORGH_AS_0776 TaxID=3041798 RepID=UPI00286572A1|nr:glycosyltransferase [Curtobacterium sp. SORGH_AS_0776]MDR6169989.1 glycosyltransferase involved in cell wall biosynthesis [Curtobacterium sp. SORGH_AS_0776]